MADKPELKLAQAYDSPEGGAVQRAAFTKLAGPWSRLWARSVDLAIYSMVVAVPVGLLLSSTIDRLVTGSSSTYIYTIITLPAALILDSTCQYFFHGSLGKLITGTTLLKTNGGKFTWIELIRRNLQIWVSGYAVGIPIVSRFTLGQCYSDVKSGRQTAWDKNLSTKVVDRAVNIYRTLLAASLFVIIQVAAVWLSATTPEMTEAVRNWQR